MHLIQAEPADGRDVAAAPADGRAMGQAGATCGRVNPEQARRRRNARSLRRSLPCERRETGQRVAGVESLDVLT